MKNLLTITALSISPITLTLTACNQEPQIQETSQDQSCHNPILTAQAWYNIDVLDSFLTFTSQCDGFETTCNMRFEWFGPTGPSQYQLNVISSNGLPGCMSVGTHTCTAEVSVDPGFLDQLILRCDNNPGENNQELTYFEL